MTKNAVPRSRTAIGGAVAVAAIVSACTITPPAEHRLASPDQPVTYSGASPIPDESITVQMQDCSTGQWVDLATTRSAAGPAGPPDACGDRFYAWSVSVRLPPLGPAWCSNLNGLKKVATRVVDTSTGYAFRSFAPGAACVPSIPCLRRVLAECGRADGTIRNTCFPKQCYDP